MTAPRQSLFLGCLLARAGTPRHSSGQVPIRSAPTSRATSAYEFIFKVKGGGVVRYTDTARAAS